MGYIDEVLELVAQQNPDQKEFQQAVKEVLQSLRPVIEKNEERYRREALLEKMVNPERVIMFRVPWQDDNGNMQINTGYRIQFNGAIGPYKGGLRFQPNSKVNKKGKVLIFSQVLMIISAEILAGTSFHLAHCFGGVSGQ